MAANLMFHQLGQRRADRVLREWFSIGRMTEEEIRRWYRFGKDSIKQIADLTQSSAPKRSQALSLSLSHSTRASCPLFYSITSHISSFLADYWRLNNDFNLSCRKYRWRYFSNILSCLYELSRLYQFSLWFCLIIQVLPINGQNNRF